MIIFKTFLKLKLDQDQLDKYQIKVKIYFELQFQIVIYAIKVDRRMETMRTEVIKFRFSVLHDNTPILFYKQRSISNFFETGQFLRKS